MGENGHGAFSWRRLPKAIQHLSNVLPQGLDDLLTWMHIIDKEVGYLMCHRQPLLCGVIGATDKYDAVATICDEAPMQVTLVAWEWCDDMPSL